MIPHWAWPSLTSLMSVKMMWTIIIIKTPNKGSRECSGGSSWLDILLRIGIMELCRNYAHIDWFTSNSQSMFSVNAGSVLYVAMREVKVRRLGWWSLHALTLILTILWLPWADTCIVESKNCKNIGIGHKKGCHWTRFPSFEESGCM